jgi:hypothetical protein
VALASTLCAGIALAESPGLTPAVPDDPAIETMTAEVIAALDEHLAALSEALGEDTQAQVDRSVERSLAAALDTLTSAQDRKLAVATDHSVQIEAALAAEINRQIPLSLNRAIAYAEHHRLRRSMSPSLATAPETRLTAAQVPVRP